MRKEKVLVRDNKGIFLKMFKRKFKDKFEFFMKSFELENEIESKGFDRSVFVIYNKAELTDFLKLEIQSSNIVVCLFEKQFYDSLSYFAEMNKIVLIDASKTKMELYKDLEAYFNASSNADKYKPTSSLFYQKIEQLQFEKFQKFLFLNL